MKEYKAVITVYVEAKNKKEAEEEVREQLGLDDDMKVEITKES